MALVWHDPDVLKDMGIIRRDHATENYKKKAEKVFGSPMKNRSPDTLKTVRALFEHGHDALSPSQIDALIYADLHEHPKHDDLHRALHSLERDCFIRKMADGRWYKQ